MATRTLYADNGKDRLVISTICNHLIIFHEAGFEYQTQRKRRKAFVVWNPATWGGGFEWVNSNAAVQPRITEFIFIQGRDVERNPADFAVANTVSRGRFKSSCVFFGANVSGTDDPSVTGGGDGGFIDLGNDARSVNDVLVRFEYDGEAKRLRHIN